MLGVFLYPPPKGLDLNGANILRLSPAGKQLGLIHLGYFGPGSGIAVDARENVTASLRHEDRISSGTRAAGRSSCRGVLPGRRSSRGGFPSPAFIALDSTGHTYMADTMQNAVREFGADGKLLHVWGGAGSYAGQFHHPDGIAVAPDGTIYVSDTENHRVQRLPPPGRISPLRFLQTVVG